MVLAGCGGAVFADVPRIANAPAGLRDAPPASAPELDRAGHVLQGDYPPEPGVPAQDFAPEPARRQAHPPRTGAGYDAPPPAPVPDGQSQPTDMPPAVAASTGPRGTSGEAQRYDTVGYATWYGEEMQGSNTASGQPFDANAITVAHRTLPLGSIVEVTALDTGRTILALVNDRGPGQRDLEIDLSRGAAQLLGVTAAAPVRVRLVNATPPDLMALRSGHPASPRIDAPQSLLTALRRKLPLRAMPIARPAAASIPAPKPRPARRPLPMTDMPPARPEPQPIPAPISTSGIFVQVAALSNESKAKALATRLNGRVQRVGAIYRIQIGPYANTASAKAARDGVARQGYGDARIVQTN
ncbi:septal ring lytic transglycosylase RlpA family protein [Sphingomonas sp. Leaf357]|uniref:septal ring lytic transglycosylase RlpA family protein n=1 Tax=Sphingomonas sp. Leaf357 TaxID=1736350 RepID=UPI0014439AC6|nr:RlpA-like double-psi beta-barrel domain-containing protein [Sphingomonas sp. Leaf357]